MPPVLALSLIALGALSRMVPHPPNATAIGALALFAGARLPRRWAFAVPLGAMLLTDLIIDGQLTRSSFSAVRLSIYGSYAMIVALGTLNRGRTSFIRPATTSAAGALLFFVATNLAVWATSGMYPATAAGLGMCFLAALPFFGNTLAADLGGTAVLFGGEAFLLRRAQPAAEPAPSPVD